jgi:Na+-translocating ferredoxin:NAD+ oxidoreductase RnfD subunit
MKILGHNVARMYVTTIVLLVLLASVSSYLLREIPYPLFLTVLICAVLEAIIRKYHQKQKFRIPFSGIITGLIIGCVAPINVPILPIAVACAIAIASKFFLKMKSTNVFNPAALGLLGLALLSIGSSWWAAASINLYGVAIPFSLVLIVAAYECRRLPLALSFIITSAILSIAGSLPMTVGSVEIALISVNYFFAFLMVTEPKTSPHHPTAQAAYGVLLAVVYVILVIALPNNLYVAQTLIFVSLLIGNAVYAIYRKIGGIKGLFLMNQKKETTPHPGAVAHHHQ